MKQIFKAAMLLTMLSISCNSYSQSKDSTINFKSKYAIFMNLIDLCPGTIINLNDGWLAKAELGLGFYAEGNYFRDPYLAFPAKPHLMLGLEYHPWLGRRIRKGKDVRTFSGVFFTTDVMYNLKYNPEATDTIGTRILRGDPISAPLSVGAGYRASFLKYGMFSIQVGPALLYDHYQKNFFPYFWGYVTFGPAIHFPRK